MGPQGAPNLGDIERDDNHARDVLLVMVHRSISRRPAMPGTSDRTGLS